jgi:hypothetical protein
MVVQVVEQLVFQVQPLWGQALQTRVTQVATVQILPLIIPPVVAVAQALWVLTQQPAQVEMVVMV